MDKPQKRYRYKQRMEVLLLMLCSTVFALGQQTNISGRIMDESNLPVIGATVKVKGTPSGTITDVNGDFKTVVKDAKTAVLFISFVGYKSQEVFLRGKTTIKVVLSETFNELQEVTVVAYGVQKKETLTGAISSVETKQLLQSPNASMANSLAGKITGLSSVQSSGQPGAEDPKIFVRGVGSLTESGATPLILVDGVERNFFQMDPNEIENVTVLKDASATAVFGVRGANGVILVTTRRGKDGNAKISVTSSVGIQQIAKWVDLADSYTYAQMYNELERNDGRSDIFNAYTLERFKLGDSPIMYPNVDFKKYMTKNAAIQTQHNLNISGGTDKLRYFVSVGYLYQDGLLKDFGTGDGYKYNRYNYRTNLDFEMSKTTTLKMGIGGVVGDKQEPTNLSIWKDLAISQPFSGVGLVDNMPMTSQVRYDAIKNVDPFTNTYGKGHSKALNNTMNLDLHLIQKLDFLTKGLSFEVKGAYNTGYTFSKVRTGNIEIYTPYFESELDGSGLSPEDPLFNNNIVYRITGANAKPGYSESTSRNRNWYFESSMRYNRKFGPHNISALILYNQNKKYYPALLPYIPTAYVGAAGRVTYDYKSRYMGEFNIGYNGSENFAPEQRFGTFPAFSLGWIVSEESFMKKQKIIDFLKIRASIGLVGNDNMNNNRYLYLPDSYKVDLQGTESGSWKNEKWAYNFGLDNNAWIKGAREQRLGNKSVTWETALKQNYGVDMRLFKGKLKFTIEYFMEDRKDILISRNTLPGLSAFSSSLLPIINMGKVKNKGYEIEVAWDDKISQNFHYYVNANMSYSKNKIVFQDEVEPNETYLLRTGRQVGATFGYVADGLYQIDDFDIAIDDAGKKSYTLKEGYAIPQSPVYPGDVKYVDLNGDKVIDPDDQKQIGFSTRPNYTFGLNFGADYKGFFFSMNWIGTAERSVALQDQFRKPFSGEGRGLMKYQIEGRWTEETAETATYPRFSKNSSNHNSMTSTLWVKDGSYLKLKNLTIGYNFNKGVFLKRLGINQLGIKFTGYNLLTFDHLHVMDPEFMASYNNTTYPITKMYNIGLNITF